MAHTPTKWRIEGRYIKALHDKYVCELPAGGLTHCKVDAANARLIVTAVNAFQPLVEALERAGELLAAASNFIRINPVKEYTVHYDEADCDGSCLKDDCDIALLELSRVLKLAEDGTE